MLVIGAKGFAIQLFDVLQQLDKSDDCVYYDDTSKEPILFLSHYPVIREFEKARQYLLNEDSQFVLGTGNPKVRSYFFDRFKEAGGIPITIISPFAKIGKYKVQIGTGTCILTNAVIESTVVIGNGNLINLNTTITHGCIIGDFCEICPGVHISGDCTIGSHSFIGTGAVILPKLKIGNNVTIGAGAVVTRDVPSGVIVKGNPGKI